MNSEDQDYIAQALPAFIAEAREQVSGIEQLLLQLEDAPDDRERLNALFRCAHTVKGSAGIFGLDEVVAFTHHVETLLDCLRDGQLQLSPALNTLLLRCNDQILALVDAAGGPAPGADVRAVLVAELNAACHVTAAPARAAAAAPVMAPPATSGRWQIAVRFGPDTFRNGTDPGAILAYLAGMGSLCDVTCDLTSVPALDVLDPESCHLAYEFGLDTPAPREQIESAFSFVQDDAQVTLSAPACVPDGPQAPDAPVAAASPPPAPAASAAAPAASTAPAPEEQRLIRVSADRLDAVINLVGELVIASAGASLLAGQSRQGALVEANSQVARLVEEIRNGALQLRMVPIGETFARFRRVVRDTAAQLGKDVALEITGGDTELDKSMVERIADPLMHLVRNGLDHGLETPADRVAAGKPAQGRLTLEACHESGSVLIRIVDDGRGIRRQKVLERAWERGLVERGVVPSDDEIVHLIFAPGFSTAEQVTNLSGRGVGMDVVRRNIESLRGTVAITSVEGQGSTIEIRLPLTLAIIDGFLMAVGDSKFILPLETVVEVIEGAGVDVDTGEGRGCIELRGHMLPVVSLRRLYDLGDAPPARSSIVVARAGHARFGILVDHLLGQHQTVIKPLGRMFRKLRGISGSTILGTGEVALILDVASFHDMAGRGASARRPLEAPVSHPTSHA